MKYPGGFKKDSLIPAVVQDFKTNQVLMLAYMNKEAYKKTLETGTCWFWSRSRNELWNKGATSGNLQVVKSIEIDCDEDTILIKAEMLGDGVACHRGTVSCFIKLNNLIENKDEKK